MSDNYLQPLIDESFEINETHQYYLHLHLRDDYFSYALLNVAKNKFITLGESFNSFENFHAIKKEHPLLSYPYGKVKIMVESVNTTLIPNALFDSNAPEKYLKFNSELPDDEIIQVDSIRLMDAVNVYSVHENQLNLIRKIYSNAEIHHSATPLLQGLLWLSKNSVGKQLILNISDSSFEAVMLDKNQAIFYNQFQFFSPEDFVYYVLFICEQLKTSPEELNVYFAGKLDRQSPVFSMVHRYIKNIDFIRLSDIFEYSYKIDARAQQSFFSLFNLGLCE